MKRLWPCLLLLAVAACGGATDSTSTAPPGPTSGFENDSSLTFQIVSVEAERFASACHVTNPPYGPNDLYSLTGANFVFGAPSGTPHPISVHITLHPRVAVGVPTNLVVNPYVPPPPDTGDIHYSDGVSAGGAGADVSLELEWPRNLDTSTLVTVVVTLLALPSRDGEQLAASAQLTFQDGKVLDVRLTAPITSSLSGCPAG